MIGIRPRLRPFISNDSDILNPWDEKKPGIDVLDTIEAKSYGVPT